jgi:hypothetical protein
MMVVRRHILRTLLHKELLSHLGNRGGLALALLLVVAALLMSLFGNDAAQSGNLLGGIQRCFLDYWEAGPWIDHLKAHVPTDFRRRIVFRYVPQELPANRQLVYPPGSGAIQVRVLGRDDNGPSYKVWFWQPVEDSGGLAPFEAWFWKETQAYLHSHAAAALEGINPRPAKAGELPRITEQRSTLAGGLDTRSLAVTALVFFAVFFVCVYLMSSLTCEERERGTLLAQALSPATPGEILLAKFLFYPALALALSALLTGILSPPALMRLPYWLTVAIAAIGSLGIGLTIASVAKTQRAASMGALCYMMAVTMLLFICQYAGVPALPNLALEYHCPRILQAAVANTVVWYHWLHLVGAGALALCWSGLATFLFRRQGWQ